ncbi:MAG: hypothetical protein L0099_11450 [Acidobacteria bacterium]|nr:hypothetical protein [Acidobacteriota bacterium]
MPKYRHRGYQDGGEEKKFEKKPRPKRDETFGPRPLQMPGKRTVSRCSQCGTLLQEISDPVGACPKCGFELHSCRQCAHFDPASRFECTQPIPERIPRKEARNECKFYLIRTTVERETRAAGGAVPPGGTGENAANTSSPEDARRAFENLFKK